MRVDQLRSETLHEARLQAMVLHHGATCQGLAVSARLGFRQRQSLGVLAARREEELLQSAHAAFSRVVEDLTLGKEAWSTVMAARLREGLSRFPWRQPAHSLLRALGREESPHAGAARALAATFALRPSFSTPQGLFSHPHDILYDPVHQNLVATDRAAGVTRRLTLDGAAAPGGLSELHSPRGLILDERGDIWVCEWGAQRLRLHDESRNASISLAAWGNPLAGCVLGDSWHVLVTDEALSFQSLLVCPSDKVHSDTAPWRPTPPPPGFAWSLRESSDGELLAVSFPPGLAFAWSEGRERWRPLLHDPLPCPARGAVAKGEHLYLSAGSGLAKLDARGDLVFFADLSFMTGVPRAPSGMCVVENTAGSQLFLADALGGDVHCFEIEPTPHKERA